MEQNTNNISNTKIKLIAEYIFTSAFKTSSQTSAEDINNIKLKFSVRY